MPIPVYWHCPNGHILGEVRILNHRHRLFVYRHSLPASPPLAHAVGEGPGVRVGDGEISAVAQGTATFYCSICGAARKWTYAGEGPSSKLADRRSSK